MEKLKEKPVNNLNNLTEPEQELARISILFYSAFISRGLYGIPIHLQTAFEKLNGANYSDKKRKVEDMAIIVNSLMVEAGDVELLKKIEHGEV